MLLFNVASFLFLFVYAEDSFVLESTECSDKQTSLRLYPADVNPFLSEVGRYNVTWCLSAPSDTYLWNFMLWYIPDHDEEHCLKLKEPTIDAKKHSVVESLDIQVNCTRNVCLTIQLDRIFEGCYYLSNYATRGRGSDTTGITKNIFLYVHNNFTLDFFTKENARAITHSDGDNTVLTWYMGRAPITYFRFGLYKEDQEDEEVTDVTKNCTLQRNLNQIECILFIPETENATTYTVYLTTWYAPWAMGQRQFLGGELKTLHKFVVGGHRYVPHQIQTGWSGATWVITIGCASALLGSFVLLALLYLRHCRLRNKLEEVGRTLRLMSNSSDDVLPVQTVHDILVLYARDCDAAMRCVDVLISLMRHYSRGKVMDIFSEDVMAEYARSPHEWMRQMLSRSNTKVLVVQTPAAVPMFQDPPLLDGSVQELRPLHREPHASDDLIRFALRSIRQTMYDVLPYTKYYITTIHNLNVDVIPDLTPFRRYDLLHNACALVSHLTGHPSVDPSTPLVKSLGDLVKQFVEYVKDNPEYLKEEVLMNIDSDD